MELKKLKYLIENKMLSDMLLIFEDWEDFLSEQYINAIAQDKNLKILHLQSIDELLDSRVGIFDSDQSDEYLRILNIDQCICHDIQLLSEKNVIIITGKINDKETRDLLSEAIVNAPKLIQWQIDEYISILVPDLKSAQRRWLIDACNNNLYKIKQELDKLAIFDKVNHAQLFDEFMLDDVFSDIATENILSFIDAIMTRDKANIINTLINLKQIDIEPLGVITLLYRNFRLMIQVQLKADSNAEELGIKPGYFYRLKKRCGVYNKNELIKGFTFISKLEWKLKSGYITQSNMIDYILINLIK